MAKNGMFTFILLELILADQLADLLPSSWYRYLVAMNGNFTFILLELILADKLADLPPLHGRGIYWPRMAILHL